MRMQKKMLGVISLVVLTLVLVSGAAFADADAQKGSIAITDIQSFVPYGGSLTFSGTILGEGNGPYEFQSIIIGDTVGLIDSWKLNKEKQTSFTATENISVLPTGKYYLILINPVGVNYEVYMQDNALYYNGVKVDTLENILGKAGTDKIAEYLQKSDVNDVYAIGEFSVVENTAASTLTASSFGIPGGMFPFLLLICFGLPLVFTLFGRRKRGNMQEPEQNGDVKQEEASPDTPPAPQSPGVCPYCGTPLDPELDFCTKCGKKLQK